MRYVIVYLQSNGFLKQTVFRMCSSGEVGTVVVQWLRRCATNRKVAGSIPDGVIGIFHRHNPSDPTMTLGSTQSLTFPGVNTAGA